MQKICLGLQSKRFKFFSLIALARAACLSGFIYSKISPCRRPQRLINQQPISSRSTSGEALFENVAVNIKTSKVACKPLGAKLVFWGPICDFVSCTCTIPAKGRGGEHKQLPRTYRPTGRLHRFHAHEVGSTGCSVISGPL